MERLEDEVKRTMDGMPAPPLADSWQGPDPDLDEEQWRQVILGRLNRLREAILQLARETDASRQRP
jgi:hypothetical protein